MWGCEVVRDPPNPHSEVWREAVVELIRQELRDERLVLAIAEMVANKLAGKPRV